MLVLWRQGRRVLRYWTERGRRLTLDFSDLIPGFSPSALATSKVHDLEGKDPSGLYSYFVKEVIQIQRLVKYRIPQL
jgi:hypothetical protein